jgi:adenylylsulfate kinase
MSQKNHITNQNYKITREDRSKLLSQNSFTVWFTGLSGSGKSTLANLLELALHQKGKLTYILDGDNIRAGLSKDLDFSLEDRKENIRRMGEVSKLMVEAGIITISAFISPLEEDRQFVRSLFRPEVFIEVFVDCPLEVCETRDVKGLYSKAREGIIKDFTGIDSPYQVPSSSELVIKTHLFSPEECIAQIMQLIETKLRLG